MISHRRRVPCLAHDEEIVALALGELERTDRARARELEDHVATCQRCEFLFWRATRVFGLARRALEESGGTAGTGDPALDAILMREIRAQKTATRRRRIAKLLFVACAVAAVVLAAGFL